MTVVPVRAAVLHAVGGGQQPAVTQHRGAAHVAGAPDLEADLPRPLPLLGRDSAHNAGAPVRLRPTL